MRCTRTLTGPRSFVTGLCLVFGMPVTSHAMCDLSVSSLNFGSYDALDHSPSDSVGTITYFCSQSVPMLTITINQSRNGNTFVRQLDKSDGGREDSLNYNVYLDPGRSSVWGDNTRGSQVLSIPNPIVGRQVDIPVYGRITGGQNSAGGNYTDTLTVTISY
jgi:spore coat protein U-like protein